MKAFIITFFSLIYCINIIGQNNMDRGIGISFGKFYFPLQHLVTERPYYRVKYGGEIAYSITNRFEFSVGLISHLSEGTRRDVRDFFGDLDRIEYKGVPFTETYSVYNFNMRFLPFNKALVKPKLQIGYTYVDGYNMYIRSIWQNRFGNEFLIYDETIKFSTYNIGVNLDLVLFKTLSISVMPSVIRDTRVGEFQFYIGSTFNIFLPNKMWLKKTWVRK